MPGAEVTVLWQGPRPHGSYRQSQKDSVQRQQCWKGSGSTGLAEVAIYSLSHLSLPFTSAFYLNLFQRKAREFHRTLILVEVSACQSRSDGLAKRGLVQKCLGKGLRGSWLFIQQESKQCQMCPELRAPDFWNPRFHSSTRTIWERHYDCLVGFRLRDALNVSWVGLAGAKARTCVGTSPRCEETSLAGVEGVMETQLVCSWWMKGL